MRRCPLALLAALALFLVGDHAVLAVNAQTTADNCDPQFRKNNPDLERAREAKKAALRRRGYPERFMKLIDKEECLYCLSISPDSFGIMFEYKDNDYAPADAKTGSKWTSITYNWTPGLERQAREQTANGTIKGF